MSIGPVLGNLIQDWREQIENIRWTVAGKVKAVERTTGSALKPLTFGYGTGGQRISKTVGDPLLPGGNRQHYVQDAQGNIMAIYTYSNGGASLRVSERPIYGSSRVGSYHGSIELLGVPLANTGPQPMSAARTLYELTDHLGNVNVVVTGQLVDGQGAGSQKQAVLNTARRYEPFGAPLPEAGLASANYRFAFNGMEKDDELHNSTGTSYDFGARLYDPRVGKWLSLDPLAAKYPFASPYLFTLDNPIYYIDPNGKEVYIFGHDAQSTVAAIQKITSLELQYDVYTGKLTAMGIPKNEMEEAFLAAINDECIKVRLLNTDEDILPSNTIEKMVELEVGGFDGNKVMEDGTVNVSQFFNPLHAEIEEKAGGNSTGTNAMHEILEGYLGGVSHPNAGNPGSGKTSDINAYLDSHKEAMRLDPNFKEAENNLGAPSGTLTIGGTSNDLYKPETREAFPE